MYAFSVTINIPVVGSVKPSTHPQTFSIMATTNNYIDIDLSDSENEMENLDWSTANYFNGEQIVSTYDVCGNMESPPSVHYSALAKYIKTKDTSFHLRKPIFTLMDSDPYLFVSKEAVSFNRSIMIPVKEFEHYRQLSFGVQLRKAELFDLNTTFQQFCQILEDRFADMRILSKDCAVPLALDLTTSYAAILKRNFPIVCNKTLGDHRIYPFTGQSGILNVLDIYEFNGVTVDRRPGRALAGVSFWRLIRRLSQRFNIPMSNYRQIIHKFESCDESLRQRSLVNFWRSCHRIAVMPDTPRDRIEHNQTMRALFEQETTGQYPIPPPTDIPVIAERQMMKSLGSSLFSSNDKEKFFDALSEFQQDTKLTMTQFSAHIDSIQSSVNVTSDSIKQDISDIRDLLKTEVKSISDDVNATREQIDHATNSISVSTYNTGHKIQDFCAKVYAILSKNIDIIALTTLSAYFYNDYYQVSVALIFYAFVVYAGGPNLTTIMAFVKQHMGNLLFPTQVRQAGVQLHYLLKPLALFATGGIVSLIGTSMPKKDSIEKIIKGSDCINRLNRCVTDLPNLFSNVLELFQSIFCWATRVLFGKEWTRELLGHHKDSIKELIVAARHCNTQEYKDKLMTDIDCQQYIRELHAKSIVYQREILDANYGTKIEREFSGIHRIITELNDIASLSQVQKGVKYDPFMVMLFGVPGIGKSTITEAIGIVLLENIGITKEDAVPFYENGADQYATGYTPRHKLWIIEDFLATEMKPEAYSKFLMMKSNCQYKLNMADLSSKGTPFNAKVIVANSNNPVAKNTGLRTDEARNRRYNACVECQIHPDYINDEGKVDWIKANAVNTTPNDFVHIQFRFVRPYDGSTIPLTEWLDYSPFLVRLRTQHRQYDQHQTKILDRYVAIRNQPLPPELRFVEQGMREHAKELQKLIPDAKLVIDEKCPDHYDPDPDCDLCTDKQVHLDFDGMNVMFNNLFNDEPEVQKQSLFKRKVNPYRMWFSKDENSEEIWDIETPLVIKDSFGREIPRRQIEYLVDRGFHLAKGLPSERPISDWYRKFCVDRPNVAFVLHATVATGAIYALSKMVYSLLSALFPTYFTNESCNLEDNNKDLCPVCTPKHFWLTPAGRLAIRRFEDQKLRHNYVFECFLNQSKTHYPAQQQNIVKFVLEQRRILRNSHNIVDVLPKSERVGQESLAHYINQQRPMRLQNVRRMPVPESDWDILLSPEYAKFRKNFREEVEKKNLPLLEPFTQIANTEGATDTQLRQMHETFDDHMYSMTISTDVTNIYCKAFSIGGTVFLMPHHAYARDALITLEGRCATVQTRFKYNSKNYFKIGNDTGVIVLGREVPARTNIIKHIIQDRDIPFLQRISGEFHEIIDKKIYIQHVEANIKANLRVEDDMSDVTSAYEIYAQTLEHNGSTTHGSCGSPLMLCNSKIPRKIIGIHIAGVPNENQGYVDIITQEMLNEVWKKIDPYAKVGEVPTAVKQSDDRPILFPMGEFEVRQTVDKHLSVFQPVTHEIERSSVFDLIFEHKTDVTVLSKFDPRGDGSSPLLKSVEKYGKKVIPYSSSAFNYARTHVIDDLLTAAAAPPSFDPMLSIDDAVFGTAWEHYDAMNIQSSPGYPLIHIKPINSIGKQGLITRAPDIIHHTILEETEDALNHWLNWEPHAFVYTAQLKSECRPLARIETSTTRGFVMQPLVLGILSRMLCGHAIAGLKSNPIRSTMAIGINPEGYQWTQLYNYLTENGLYVIAGDYKEFDGRVRKELSGVFFDFVWKYTKLHFRNQKYVDYTINGHAYRIKFKKYKQLLKMLRDAVLNSPFIVSNTIINSLVGIYSGSEFTSWMGSTANKMNWYCHLYEQCVKHNCVEYLQHPSETLKQTYFSDDHIINPRPELRHIINFNTMKQFMSYHGMQYTATDKTEDARDLEHIKDVKYLKRSFVTDDGFRYKAPLETSVLEEMINWVTTRGPGDKQTKTLDNMRTAQRYAYMHGERFYKEFSGALNLGLARIGVAPLPNHYEIEDTKWLADQF